MFLTAFAIGALGSFHCIGMCGPIALSVPLAGRTGWAALTRGLTYNAGRILMYAILGTLVGLIGQQFMFARFQQVLSMVVGVSILVFLFLPGRITRKVDPTAWLAGPFLRLRSTFHALFRSRGPVGPFALGLINGLLPCGLVYVGLAGALALGGPLNGATFMMAFGMGTVPVMISIILAGDLISLQWRVKVRKLLPIMFALMGVLFVLRGMDLGIPYISPDMSVTQVGGTPKCHTP